MTRRYRLAVPAEAWSAYCRWELGPDAIAWPIRGVVPWTAARDGWALATRRSAEEFAQRVSAGAAVVAGIPYVVTVYSAEGGSK